MNHKNIVFFASLWCSAMLTAYTISMDEQSISASQKVLQININLDSQESILKQTMSVSVDSPHVAMGDVTYNTVSEKKYISQFADSKEVFTSNLSMTIPVNATKSKESVDAHLHLSFLTLPDSAMHEQIYNVSFTAPKAEIKLYDQDEAASSSELVHASVPATTHKKSFTEYLQGLMQNSDSLWIRLLFAFLLGLLLSLTPCIYPMIPITIGVLHHNQKTSSVGRNFIGSLCYAFGVSTTFACLGLLAAFAGASFGSLLSQPAFVLVMVAFIGYMSLTMIGVIDLTLPSFLQKGTQINSSFGPFLSVYIFGLISGSVASPCVSPGLALLLTIVATMGSALSGFLLLFSFGIGMSVPLIIIGTFSSSLNMLPQAGQWMVEVKKALGFVMLATCLYYLNNITPGYIFHWFVAAYFLFTALFYIIDAQKDFDQKQKTIKSLLGIILLAITVVMCMRAYNYTTSIASDASGEQGVVWADDYETARTTAEAENKLVLLDFWAHHCTICKAIDKKIFKKDVVWNNLSKQYVFVKVDCTTNTNAEANKLKKEFQVFAQPAILIVNPKTGELIKKWSSEPYSMTPEAFVAAAIEIKKFQNS